MRLIDADALKIDYGFTWDDITPTHEEMYALIDRQPTIEERKTGEWTSEEACEFCGFQPWYENDIHTLSFCPNCGADMRGEREPQ
jgi:hypothetical protein